MPRGSWLGLVVCVIVATPAVGQEFPPASDTPPVHDLIPDTVAVPNTGPLAQPGEFPGATTLPPQSGMEPHAHFGQPALLDLTPEGFVDLHPPPDPHHEEHHVPGHLEPTVPGHAGFYGSAEYLLFRPRSGAFDYALLNASPGLATVGDVQSLKYDLGNGFRTDLGYRFESGWDAEFGYTYFRADADRSVFAAPGQVVFPTLTRPGLTETALFANAEAGLDYSLYDMTIGKRFAFDDCFGVRGFAGFRFADIRQDFNALYNGLDANSAVVSSRSTFKGFGPIVGGEAVLGGWHGFHAYARASGGLLTGRSANRIRETNNLGATVYVDSNHNVQKVIPVASIGIGGGWQYRTVSIRAGYEVTHWFGLTEPTRFVDDVGQGKFASRPSYLSLEGFFVQVGLAF